MLLITIKDYRGFLLVAISKEKKASMEVPLIGNLHLGHPTSYKVTAMPGSTKGFSFS